MRGRVDDRRVIGGIIHVLQSVADGTIIRRALDRQRQFQPRSPTLGRRVWHRILAALIAMDGREFQAIDSTAAKAHRA